MEAKQLQESKDEGELKKIEAKLEESKNEGQNQNLESDSTKVNWDALDVEAIDRPFETFKGPSIVASPTPPLDHDWTPHFINNTIFESKDKLIEWIRGVGKVHKMVIVVKRSDFKRATPRIFFSCERSGAYRPSSSSSQSSIAPEEEEKKRETGSRKCGCSFQIKATKVPNSVDFWVIQSVMCGKHNHPLSSYIEGHAQHARLSPSEKEAFISLSKGGVKPKTALSILKEKNPENSASLQTLYNAKKKFTKEAQDDRTEFQQLMKLAEEAGYVIGERRNYENDIVRDFFFAHPDSIQLAKCFPYIFVMDCTYKTNIHKWPLFEIVGITSTMKTFSVCYCFMEQETFEHFHWALLRFKSLLFEDQVPLTFITDREQALMKAIEVVFPSTSHLLCRWHIAMGIEKKGKAVLPKDGEVSEGIDKEDGVQLKLKWRQMWDFVVYSSTLKEYEDNLSRLKEGFSEWPSLYEYASSWLVLKEKFVSVWTDKVFHVGNTATNRVEGAHSTLKDSLLRNSRHTFLSMWQMIHNSLGIQVGEIKKSFTASLNRHAHSHRIGLFRDIRGFTSAACLQILRHEYDRFQSGRETPELCRCVVPSTHGLPCACKLGPFARDNQTLSLTDLHPFWRKLSVEPRRVEFDELELHEEFQVWFAAYKRSSSDQKKYLLRRLREDACKENTWLNAPLEPVQGKGRPPNPKPKPDFTTKREPSAFEQEVPDVPPPPPGVYYSQGSTHTKPVSRPKTKGKVRAKAQPKKKPKQSKDEEGDISEAIPVGYEKYIDSVVDVLGDGNCGFRAVAVGMGMDPNVGWRQVRTDCISELDRHKNLYARMFGGEGSVDSVRKRLDHFHSPTLQSNKFWMLMPETGYIIANAYNVVVVYLGRQGDFNQMLTFLPQLSAPPVQASEVPKFPMIAFMFWKRKDHFVSVNLKHHAPIPPPTTFSTRFAEKCAIGWEDLVRVKADSYRRQYADKFSTNDKEEVYPLCFSDSD